MVTQGRKLQTSKSKLQGNSNLQSTKRMQKADLSAPGHRTPYRRGEAPNPKHQAPEKFQSLKHQGDAEDKIPNSKIQPPGKFQFFKHQGHAESFLALASRREGEDFAIASRFEVQSSMFSVRCSRFATPPFRLVPFSQPQARTPGHRKFEQQES